MFARMAVNVLDIVFSTILEIASNNDNMFIYMIPAYTLKHSVELKMAVP